MASILALDVGSKRIGVAVSDPSETFALPVGMIERSNLNADIAKIKAYIEDYSAIEVVIGDPITLAGTRGLAAEKIDAFVERMRASVVQPVIRIDERMTTAQATKTLIAADVSRKKRRQVVDKIAATLILETYLARRKYQGR